MAQVGFIGVGTMGGAIASRLAENGVGVLAYDPNPAAIDRVCAAGGKGASSAQEVVDSMEIVFACLPTPEVSRSVAFGPGGVSAGTKVKIYVEHSTLGGAAIKEIADGLAKHEITVLDTPVIGGTVALEVGSLGVLSSGPKQAYETVRPILDVFAGKLFYFGEQAGAAQVAKLINNAVGYANLYSAFEAVAVGLKAGMEMDVLVDLINAGSGANFATQLVFPNYLLKNNFGGTGPVEVGEKDVKLFLKEAERLGAESPMASKVAELATKVTAHGEPGRDTLTGFFYFCELAGVDPERFA